jgi:fumarate reductase flavoprotein subunit
MKKHSHDGKIFLYVLLLAMIAGACKTPVDTESHLFDPGTYTNSSQGYMNPVSVTVAFSEDAIESIVVGSDHQQSIDRPEVAEAIVQIPRRIYEGQTLKVDVVSGASFTSRAIVAAVEKCVKQAGGDEAVAKLKESGTAKFLGPYLGKK